MYCLAHPPPLFHLLASMYVMFSSFSIQEKQLSKFHVAEWLGFMQRLQDKYQELVLPDMQELGRV